ncbi:hypothetical protein EVAR_35210_1 [Eumeta japonica]|uniref:Uncharacterized protein n=1 Tax=Eumeta variegata TaxID=151549 RepID=A0A4C1VCW7_EUMVA|nr:hypothetical protein EVAR_35210_1 [Eumeta japonica]
MEWHGKPNENGKWNGNRIANGPGHNRNAERDRLDLGKDTLLARKRPTETLRVVGGAAARACARAAGPRSVERLAPSACRPAVGFRRNSNSPGLLRTAPAAVGTKRTISVPMTLFRRVPVRPLSERGGVRIVSVIERANEGVGAEESVRARASRGARDALTGIDVQTWLILVNIKVVFKGQYYIPSKKDKDVNASTKVSMWYLERVSCTTIERKFDSLDECVYGIGRTPCTRRAGA